MGFPILVRWHIYIESGPRFIIDLTCSPGMPQAGTLSKTLHWRHNEREGVSNHRRCNCLLNRLFRYRSKKTSKLRATGLCEGNPAVTGGLCEGNPPVTGGFPSQRACNAENASIWWRYRTKRPRHRRSIFLSSGVANFIKMTFRFQWNASTTHGLWDNFA